ncbi:MAG: ACT domain-containing protein [Armatimonadetes bacterium]|nr:ACT domain-containing protein [Armatimonadota bacterium]NIO74916.1 ACT domain-containing protein [Armatimonadota bacterium]NIO96617.1 ACT domain-containing protein [Armatimonadota bacterium]
MARGVQLCVSLENKPGQLARVGAALARAKVNIEAISVVDTASGCLVRLVTSSSAKAKVALSKAGMPPMQQPVIVLRLLDAPGALAKVARKLSSARINIDYVYGSAAGTGKASLLVLGVDNIAKASAALKKI